MYKIERMRTPVWCAMCEVCQSEVAKGLPTRTDITYDFRHLRHVWKPLLTYGLPAGRTGPHFLLNHKFGLIRLQLAFIPAWILHTVASALHIATQF